MKRPLQLLRPPSLGGSRALPAVLLRRLLSLLYGVGVHISHRRRLSSARSLDCPVLSVGNLTAGGTGKTPLVTLIARRLRGRGWRVGIALKGYGGLAGGGPPVTVSAGAGPLMAPREAGDEAYQMTQSLQDCAIVIGADRYQVGRRLLEEHQVDIVLLDDGFQTVHLRRDLDIVCINAADPLGGNRLLPAGLLREPASGLRRAGGVCLTRTEMVGPEELDRIEARLRQLNGEAWIVRSGVEVSRIASFTDDREWAAESLAGTRVYLFSGLGDNRYFRHTARNLGVEVAGHAEFPDHHWYKAVELATLMESAVAAGAKALMTSAKDAVRLETIRDRLAAAPDILVLKANQVIYNENPLTDSLDRLLGGG